MEKIEQKKLGFTIFMLLLILSITSFLFGRGIKLRCEPQKKIEQKIKHKQKEIILRATAFHMTKKDYKTYNMDSITISQTRYIAISRELLDSFNLKRGDTIMVSSPFFVNGKWIILSVTNKRIKNTIDFLFPFGQQCFLDSSKIIINYDRNKIYKKNRKNNIS